MRSIPAAMTWEILKRGRWQLVFAMLVSIAFPALLLVALGRDGLVDAKDPSMLIMQIVLLQVGMFSFGSALYGAQGKMSRLYAYPARTSELVAWRLIPVMVLIALQVMLSICVLDMLFGLEWPIWGPALFSAVAIAAVIAVAWLTEKSVGWMVVGLAIVGSALALWFRSRYGGMFSNPIHIWEQVTPGEVLTMLAAGFASYGIAVLGVARNRRGEPPLSVGFSDWLERMLESSMSGDMRLTTPFQAQCWIAWRRKGWAMPMTAFGLLIFGLIVWFFSSRKAEDLFFALFVSGHMLGGLGFVGGLMLGNAGTNEATYAMGHFFSTRPMSDTDMARAILRTAVKSILMTWSIWIVALLIVCGGLYACGASDAIKLPKDWSWWYFPVTLLGPWIVTGNFASLMLQGGRQSYVLGSACGAPIALMIMAMISRMLLSHEAQFILNSTLVVLTATSLVIASVWAFVAARRRNLIQGPTLWAAAIVWMTATIALALKWPDYATPHWIGYLLIAAASALVVAPVASVPLALSWNRHR
jgi:hypothetical protein